MEIIIQPDSQTGSRVAACMVADLVRANPNAVLGLATGSTPLGLYRELARMHREEGLDFGRVTTFNLDEYIGLPPEHPQSYRFFMHKNLFQYINVPADRIHIPDGMAQDVRITCAAYEQSIRDAGGIDLQILGIGTDGHMGFNEPTSSLASRTRIKTLTRQTLGDNARFFKRPQEQPYHAITMGIGSIMDSRQVVLLAFGAGKAKAVAASLEGPITSMVPASALQLHERAHFIIDEAAASHLSQIEYYRWVYEHKPAWQQH